MKLKLLQRSSISKDFQNPKQSERSPLSLHGLPNVSFVKKPSSIPYHETTPSCNSSSDLNLLSTELECRKDQAKQVAYQPGNIMRQTSDKLTQEINEFVKQVNAFQKQSRVMIDVILDSVKAQIARHFIHSPEVDL